MKYRITKYYDNAWNDYRYYLDKKILGIFWWNVHYGYGWPRTWAKGWAKQYKIKLPE